jgi:hypothetical protein
VSAAAKAHSALALVSLALHRRLGLLAGWRFYRLPRRTTLVCMCGRPAAFTTAPEGGVPRCEKHARDF